MQIHIAYLVAVSGEISHQGIYEDIDTAWAVALDAHATRPNWLPGVLRGTLNEKGLRQVRWMNEDGEACGS